MVQALHRWTEYRVPDTLPDDTEESVVGTEWHQEAISALTGMLREAARRQGASWDACDQIALMGLRRTDDRPYDPRPDVMILARPLPSGASSSIALTDAGVPLFIAEVASRGTVSEDIGEKRRVYEAIGVQEYIVYDPDGSLLSTPLRAWRLEDEAFVPWHAEQDGFWHSRVLGVTIEPTQPLLNMRDWMGEPIDPPRRAWERAHEADTLERRVRDLEDELRRLREDPTG